MASIAVRVLNVIFTMLLIGHWNGCFMFLFPRLAQFPEDCWVTRENITVGNLGLYLMRAIQFWRYYVAR